MKLLESAIKTEATPEDCAREVLDVVPAIMQAIRAGLREHRSVDLSVPQLRALSFIDLSTAASLSELAEHIGLTLPSMSKMIDGLVERGLITRSEDPQDRRRVVLCLTSAGRESVEMAQAATRAAMAERVAHLGQEQRAAVMEAMDALRPLFRRQG